MHFTKDHTVARHGRPAMLTVGLVITLATLLVGAGGSLASMTPRVVKAKTPIILGCPCALSGPFASFEVPIYQGIQTGAAIVNQEGGVLGGRKLQVVSVDDTGDPTKAVPALQQLLTTYPHMAALFTDVVYMGSQFPYADQYHMPAFSAGTGPYFLPMNSGYPYAFNNYSGGATQVPAAIASAVYLNKHPVVAILTDTTAADIILGQDTAAGLTAEGYQVVDTETVSPTATDISVQVDSALSHNPNEIITYSASAPCEAMGAALRTADHPGVDAIITSACATQNVLAEIPPSAGGDQLWVGAWPIQVESGKLKGPLPKYQHYAKVLKQISGSLASLFISGNYSDTVSILAWAMDKAGTPSGPKVLKALETLHKVTLPKTGIGSSLNLANPNWSPTVHDLSKANLTHYFALIRGGPQVNGTNPGVVLTTKPLPPGVL